MSEGAVFGALGIYRIDRPFDVNSLNSRVRAPFLTPTADLIGVGVWLIFECKLSVWSVLTEGKDQWKR